MSFAEKMQVASLVLEYAKVVFGYSVTIPLLILFLCWLFRSQVGRAIDAVRALSLPGGASVNLAERAAVEKFHADIERTKEATAYATVQQLPPQPPPNKVVDAIASFFGLTARLLPLVPKAERRRFLEEETRTLPEEFSAFRLALFKLADEAPELRALTARDVIITPETGTFRLHGGNVEMRHERKGHDDDPEDPNQPAPKV